MRLDQQQVACCWILAKREGFQFLCTAGHRRGPFTRSTLLSGQLQSFSPNNSVGEDTEVAWSSGLGRWIWNLEVPGSNPPPYYYLDLFSVVPSLTPRPRCVNRQLVSLPPVGILISLCYIYNLCLFIYSVPNSVVHRWRHENLPPVVTQTNKPFHWLLLWERRMEQRRTKTLQSDTQRLISQFDDPSSSKCWRKPTKCTLE